MTVAAEHSWLGAMARRLLGRKEFVPPVIRPSTTAGSSTLDVEERALLVRLMDELRALLDGPDDNALLERLFPTAYPDDEEKEAEYQRLMREELVASRVAAIESVSALLGPGDAGALDAVWDEGQTIAFMQSINAIRLVLGIAARHRRRRVGRRRRERRQRPSTSSTTS